MDSILKSPHGKINSSGLYLFFKRLMFRSINPLKYIPLIETLKVYFDGK